MSSAVLEDNLLLRGGRRRSCSGDRPQGQSTRSSQLSPMPGEGGRIRTAPSGR